MIRCGINVAKVHVRVKRSFNYVIALALMYKATIRLQSIRRQMASVAQPSHSKLKQFSACELSDALIKLGLPHGGHIPDIRRVTSYDGSIEERICGPAYTVQMVYASDRSAPKPEKHFVDTVVEGSVVVIDAPPSKLRNPSIYLNILYDD